MASGAGAAPRRDAVQGFRAADRAQGRVRARHDPRDGQGHQGDPRRRAGGHRLRLLHRRRRPPTVRADRAVGAAQQVCHGHPPAAGRLRHDHAVELPHGDPVVEAVSRAGRRQHRGHQARAGHAALDLELRARRCTTPAFPRAWSISSPDSAAKLARRWSSIRRCARFR